MKKITLIALFFAMLTQVFSQITLTPVHVTSCSSPNGAIYTKITNSGTPPYSFQWSNGSTNAYIENLTTGNYCLTITDAYCCSTSGCVEVKDESIFTLTATLTNPKNCSTDNGKIVLSNIVENGAKPIQYTWSWKQNGITQVILGSSNSPNISALNQLYSGVYILKATDANGCTTTQEFELTSFNDTKVYFEELVKPCGTQKNGVLKATSELIFAGGYDFTWTSPIQSDKGTYTSTISNIEAGTYFVYVERNIDKKCGRMFRYDLKGSSFVADDIKAIVKNTCKEKTNGSITLDSKGFGTPFSTIWSSNAPNNSNNKTILNNLEVGKYTVTVTNSCGQKATKIFEVKTAGDVTVQVNNAACSKLLTATMTNPTMPVNYTWQHDLSGNAYPNINPLNAIGFGVYNVTATDGNGCISSRKTYITPPADYTYSITEQPCKGIQGSGSVLIMINNPNNLPLQVSFGKTILPVVKTAIIANLWVANLTGLSPYSNNIVTIKLGDCENELLVQVGEKGLDKIFNSFDEPNNKCIYDEKCGSTIFDKTYSTSPVTGDLKGGWLQGCKVELDCINFQDPTKNFSAKKLSFPKKTMKVGKFIILLEIALTSGFIDQTTYDLRRDELKNFNSLCDKVRFCTTPGFGGFQLWQNPWNGPGNVLGNNVTEGDMMSDPDKPGCFIIDCPEFLKGTDEFCLDEILPSYMQNNISINPPVFTPNCQLRRYPLYQVILWELDLESTYPNTYINSELAELVKEYRFDSRAKCATVEFCKIDFSVRYSNVKSIDCTAYTDGQGDTVAPCNAKCYNSDCTIQTAFCYGNNTGLLDTTIVVGLKEVGFGTKFPGDVKFKTHNPYGSNSLDPTENYKFSSFHTSTLENFGISRRNEQIIPKGLMKTNLGYAFLDYNHGSYAKREIEIPNVTHIIDDYETDKWIYTTKTSESSSTLEFDSEENKAWTHTFASQGGVLKIENLDDSNGFITITGQFTGALLVNEQIVAENKLPSAFVLKYDHSGNLLSNTILEHINANFTTSVHNGTVYLNGQTLENGFIIDNQVIDKTEENSLVTLAINKDGKIENAFSYIKTSGNLSVLKAATSPDGSESVFILQGQGELIANQKAIYTNKNEVDLLAIAINRNGDARWVKPVIGQNVDSKNITLTYDDSNQLLLGLTFNDVFEIDQTTFKSNGGNDILLLKMDNEGNLAGSKHFGSEDDETITHLLRDNKGILYFGGQYGGTTQSRIIGNYQFVNSFKRDIPQGYISYIFEKDLGVKVGSKISNNSLPTIKIIENKTDFDVQIYPNPFNNNLNININCAATCDYEVRITNTLGSLLWQKKAENAKGNTLFEVEAAQRLVNGVYFVEVKSSEGKTAVYRVVKN